MPIQAVLYDFVHQSQPAEQIVATYADALRPDQVYAATAPRAEAYKTWILGGPDPDYTTIGKLLVESYRNLKLVLQRARAPRPTAIP